MTKTPSFFMHLNVIYIKHFRLFICQRSIREYVLIPLLYMYQTPNWEYFVDVEFSSFLDREKYLFRSKKSEVKNLQSFPTLIICCRTSKGKADIDDGRKLGGR